ncbi:MAG: patatin-like phospholipase family protein [Candidatus Azambacteria bacterium]|nr:patatin-like phospholipase family protein [Candidatus Azambacteria bacterium]
MEKHTAKHKKVGLALGGGGAKGFAHVGIIKALEAAGINIDYIAGTSMGALIGGYYAATKNIKALEELSLGIKKSDIFPISEIIHMRNGVLFRGESIAKLLDHHLTGLKIEDCKIPFTSIATDVKNGDEIKLKSGNLVDAIRASIAIPMVFSPVEIDGRLLMDGGLSNPVPANIVREMGADVVIAVDVSSRWITAPDEIINTRDIYSLLRNTLSVIEYQIAKGILKDADIVLRPPVLTYDWLAFDKSAEIIKTGQRELEINLKDIRKKTGYRAPRRTTLEKFFDFIINK